MTENPASMKLRLTSIRYAGPDTTIYSFERPDGGPLPPAQAGAHIGILLPGGLERQYSLVFAPPAPTAYVVAVKKEGAGRGGSAYLHDVIRVGATVEVLPPRNNFPLAENADYSVLIAGGIGVTPIYCMAQRLSELGRRFEFHYASRSREDAALLAEIEALPDARLHFDQEAKRIFPIGDIVSAAPAGAHLYCCGPKPMIAAFEAACEGRPPETVHVEYFGAREEAALGGGFTVKLARSNKEVLVPPGKSILHAVQDIGIQVPSSCEEGVCGACETRVVSGVPDHRDAILSEQERRANKTMMICCSGSKTETITLDL